MKTPIVKKAAKKSVTSKTTVKAKKAPAKKVAVKTVIKKKSVVKKMAAPEFTIPAAVKKTISNEIERVMIPVKKSLAERAPLNLPIYNEAEKTCSCCGQSGTCGFGKGIFGLVLIVFGLLYLGKNLGILPFSLNLNFLNFWPLIIIVIGFFLVNKKAKLSILAGIIGAASFALIIYFILLYADSTFKADEETMAPSTIVPHIEKSVETTTVNKENSDSIKLSNVFANQVIDSPLHIEGEARGAWFFEASFPVKVVDENLNELGRGVAKADGNWMTNDFVKFTADITYKKSTSTQATIILEKDNPSGLEANYERFIIPVTLK